MQQQSPRDAVQFTRESAERIASVVRSAETAPAGSAPLTFSKRFVEQVPKQVRAATFSGAWPIGSVKNVTFKHAPTATADVTNLSWPITLSGYVDEDCLVGREGTNWWLIAPVLQGSTAVFVTRTAPKDVVTDILISATLDTDSCAITVGKTLTTSTISVISQTFTSAFLRLRVP